MTGNPARRSARRPGAPALLALVLVAGCSGLRDAEGTEAMLIARAETLPALTAAMGDGAQDVARNGVLRAPAVREAASLVSASADEVRVARAALFPSLGLSFGGGVGDAGSGSPALSLEGTQRVFDFGNTRREITLADLDLQIDYYDFQGAVDTALLEALIAYDSVHTYTRLLAIHRAHLAELTRLEGLVAARTESGAASSTDRLEAQTRLQAAAFLVSDTELALAEAQDRLVRLTGQDRGGRFEADPGSCSVSGVSDEMRVAQLQLARAQLAAERAERARTPRIVLSPLVRSELGDGTTSFGMNVGVQSDLLQGGALTARARAAWNAYAGAQARLEAVTLDDELDARGLQRTIGSGSRRVQMLERQIALLAETRALYRSQYLDLGTRQITELLDNEQEYYTRQAELAEELSEVSVARLRCADRSGTLRAQLALENYSLYGFPLVPDPL